MIICNFANGRSIILFSLILSETTFQAQVEVIIAVIERNSPWSTRTWTIFHPNFNWIYLRALNFFERHDIYEEGNGRPTDAYKIWYAECFCLPGNSSLFSFCLVFYLFIFFFSEESVSRRSTRFRNITNLCIHNPLNLASYMLGVRANLYVTHDGPKRSTVQPAILLHLFW